ncbi:FtsB family cell division protein [Bacillus pinisoli]|uniref:FtsB family cell division protein n=1 Tax=Bacillus pinisoli TaxID=2901866 RepID=UPI001FF55CFA|nr:septum formation initiator family protein [Bacillus pinisoli]
MDSFSNDKIKKIQSDYYKIVEQREKLVLHRRRGLIRRLTAFGIIVGILSYIMISTFLSQIATYENKLEERDQLKAELQDMQDKQVKLEDEIVKLNDDEYIAKIARRDYFLSEDHEIIFSIPEEETSY